MAVVDIITSKTFDNVTNRDVRDTPRMWTLPWWTSLPPKRSTMERFVFFSSRRRHTICLSDWSSDVCSSDLAQARAIYGAALEDRINPRSLVNEPVERRLADSRSRPLLCAGQSGDAARFGGPGPQEARLAPGRRRNHAAAGRIRRPAGTDRAGRSTDRRNRPSDGAPRSQGPRRRPHGGYALLQRLHAGRNRPGDRTHRPPGALPLGERYEVAQEDAAVRSLTSGAANEPAARGLLPGSNSSAVASISMDSSENRTSRPLASPRTRSGRSSAASGSRSLSWRPVSISSTSLARL